MGYKRVIQLRKLKDKVSKRYFVNIRFYHRGNFLFEGSYDIYDMIIDNDWKGISFGESIQIFQNLFNMDTGDYPIQINQNHYWCIKEDDGFSICLKDEDLAKLRDRKIKDLGL